jgi:hypothetical protein
VRPEVVRRALWTLPFAFATGLLFHLWVAVRLLPWWPVAVPAGALLLVASKPLLLPSPRRTPGGRTVAGAAVAYAGASLLINSLWPLVLLVPGIFFIVRWTSVRATGGAEGP